MKSKKSCFACGKKSSTDLRLHRFPKDPVIHSCWKLFCLNFLPNVREEDDFYNCFICDEHFVDDCFRGTKKHFLRYDAVPTIISGKFDKPRYSITTICNHPDADLNIGSRSETCSSSTKLETAIVIDSVIDEDLGGDSDQQTVLADAYIPKAEGMKRKIYIGDFDCFDMHSPEQAMKYFVLSKNILQKKDQMIKKYQQKCKRLHNRLTRLKESVGPLKKNNLFLKKQSAE